MYTPEANGRLEAWHRFFKACVAKHIRGNAAEWDEVVPLAAAAYNFFPCQAAGESPFVLMFGRDPITPFAKATRTNPKVLGRPWGSPENGFIKETLPTHSRECKKGKRRARSRRKEAGEQLQGE